MQVRSRRRGGAILTSLAVVGALLIPVAEKAGATGEPSVPRTVAAAAGPAAGMIALSWVAPAVPNGTITSYQVATAEDGGAFGAPVDVGAVKKKSMPCAGVVSCDFTVFATNANGQGPASAPATGVWTVSAAPKIAKVVAGPPESTMTVTWAKPSNTGGQAVTGYEYDVSADGGSFSGPVAVPGGLVTGAQLPCASTAANGTCLYRLYAQNSVGLSGPSIARQASYVLPGAPVLLSATSGRDANTVKLAWDAPSNTGGLAITEYNYVVSTDGGSYLPGSSSLPLSPTRAVVPCTGVNNCSYRVYSVTVKGASVASNTKTTAYDQPAAPTNLRARVSSISLGSGAPSVTFTWAAPGDLGGLPVDHYEVRQCSAPQGGHYTGYCATNDGAWASATIVPVGLNTTFSTSCAAGLVTCSFEVRAINAVGPSPWAKPAFIAPFAPTTVTAVQSQDTSGGVVVTWGGPAESGDGVDHLVLYSCLTASGCSNSANWSDTGLTIAAGSHGVTHVCGAGVQCNYRVVAVETGSGASGASSSSASNVGSSPPQAPQNLTAASSATTIGAVNLAWQAPVSSGTAPITDYVFERSVNSGAFSAPISTGGTALSYVDTACGASDTCTYKVAAIAAGSSPFGNTATGEGANTPSAPQNLNATSGTTFGAVDLTWQAPLDNGGQPVTAYFLERSLDGGTSWPTNFTLGAVLSYDDAACGAGVTCTYRVSAMNTLGTGTASNTAAAVGTNLSPPQNLTAVTNSDSSPGSVLGGADLAWDPPASDSGFPIQGYEYRYQTNSGAFSAWGSTGTGTGTSFTPVCGQDNTCNYELRAFNAIGTSSPSNDAAAAGRTDHTAPTVTITAPGDASRFQTRTPTISGTAGNATGDSTTVNITIRQAVTLTVIRTFAATRTGTTWTVGAPDWAAGSPIQLSDGNYLVSASQTDWASNTGTSSPAIAFSVDNVAPTPTITAPLNTGNIDTTTTAYAGAAGNAPGDSTTVSVTVCSGTSAGCGSPTDSFNVTRSGATWSTTRSGLAEGVYTAQATQTDAAGNSASVTSTFQVNDAIFVSTGGNDTTGTGTVALPKRTVQTGIATAVSQSRTKVIVLSGTYAESLSVTNAITVLGGYSGTNWARPGTAGASGTPNQTLTKIQGAPQAAFVTSATVTFDGIELDGLNTGLAAGSSVYGLRAITGANVTLQNVKATAAAGVAGTGGSNGGAGTNNPTSGAAGVGGANGNTGGNGAAGTSGGSGGGGGGSGGLASGINSGAGAGGAAGGGAGGGGYGNCNSAGGRGGDGSRGGPSNTGGTFGTGGATPPAGGSCGFSSASGGAGTDGGAGSAGTTPTVSGGTGGTGATGTAGAAGVATNGGMAAWSTAGGGSGGGGGTGSTGGVGNAGGGGLGGGGGGGGGAGSCNIACSNDRGGGGGGGGGGGQGGGAGSGGPGGGGGALGTGGGGGGGSFAVYSFNSTVTITAGTTLVAGAGANGGNGGGGGAGGTGGPGGTGGTGGAAGSLGTAPCAHNQNCYDNGAGGGNGGAGGKGGNGTAGGQGGVGGPGGGGAGGSGGPSIAAYSKGTNGITISGGSTTTFGAAGTGGSAGSPNGAPGTNGIAVATRADA